MKHDLFCQRMADRLKVGTPVEIAASRDIEATTGTMIAHGVLRPATIRGEFIARVAWSGHVLFGLHFIGCNFDSCDFSSADLRGASFVDCSLTRCRFEDADMAGAYVHASEFVECGFTGTRLTGAEFSRSKVRACSGWPEQPDSYRNEVV